MTIIKITRRAFLILLAAPLFILPGCAKEGGNGIVVSAAVSLKDAFEDIGALYRQRYGDIPIHYNYGASGALQKQISAGAPVDIFASASQKFMDVLDKEGRIPDGTRKNFARNGLVIIVPKSSRAVIRAVGDLLQPGFRRIAMGNPDTVPAGIYAAESLAALKLREKLQPRLVYAENVRQVLDYVVTGEADAGFVYRTDTYRMEGKISIALTVPEKLYRPILYPIAVIKGTKNEGPAGKFVETVISPEGRDLLRKYGYREK